MGCPKCGSWAVRADRSLAGRMVCARCGEPLGIGRARRVASGTRRRGPGRGNALARDGAGASGCCWGPC
ncbi:hypothetical protein KBZ33_07370 [Cyanobium sp. Cruz-8D1]|nr:hypothetical protein [Cyanobium sp. Cruz-8H5]MCP9866122.1 hypothetical protein [Cyanobium sp. Cruz-8D1]